MSSSSHDPAVAFTDLEFPVRFYGRVFSPSGQPGTRSRELHLVNAAYGTNWFGEVTADDRTGSLNLAFAVEGQPSPSGYQFCASSWSCRDVSVQVTSGGLLYLQQPTGALFQHAYFADFPTLPVELSATDSATELKVYREVLVGPPSEVTGCDDYGDNTPEAYTCMFLRELLPSEPPTGVSESTLRASLPGLVQNADNYKLVFSEEFDSTPPAANDAGCSDGLSTLDNEIWNYYDACDLVDSRSQTCGNVVGGELVFGHSARCMGGFLLASRGKLHAKYGYIEIKYSFNRDAWEGPTNYNFILYNAGGNTLRYHYDQYGVEVQDWEDYLTNIDTEIDIFEHIGARAFDVSHQYANWWRRIRHPDLHPTRTYKQSHYCSTRAKSFVTNPDLPCESNETFTITRGVEWTPRGYRTFIKVDGFQDEMIVVPKEKIDVEVQAPGSDWWLSGSAKDPYFEYVDPKDPDTILEQVAIAHAPLPINANVWGNLRWNQSYVRTWMKIDYIRVWQPEDHYSNMEPVYQ